MNRRLLVGFVTLLATAAAGFLPAQAPRGGGGGQPPGAPISGPAAGSASVRLEDWGRLRTAAAPLLGWKVGVPATGFGRLTFFEAAGKADVLGVASIEGFSTQKLSPEIPKNLDYNLAPGEVTAVKDRLRALNLRMPAYFIATIGPDENASRKLFEFAKNLGVETIVSAPGPDSLPAIDKLANEFGINVALYNRSRKETPAYWDPKSMLAALEGRSKRIGVCADIGYWMQEGIKPLDALALVKDRVIVLKLRDRTLSAAKAAMSRWAAA